MKEFISQLDIKWPESAAEAVIVQKELGQKVQIKNNFKTLKIIAGVDCSYDIKNNLSHAYVVLMELDNLKPITSTKAELPTTFPYIPGFLSFREIPVILEALKLLPQKPNLFMVDGQGIAHPRRMGIAAHLGVLLDMPSIGVAKSRLTGVYKEPGFQKGNQTPLMDKNEQIGTVLRSKDNVKPLFISPGHKVDNETAVKIVERCLTRYKLPEPTRIADKISKQPYRQNNLFE